MGTKLEHIIICLADEIEEKEKEQEHVQNKPEDTVEKAPWVKPSDKHFWFGRPGIFLYMIHFILFQNSFEIAFFLWVLVSSKQQVTCTVLMESFDSSDSCIFFAVQFTYGVHSCILEEVGLIIPRLLVG